MGIVHNHGITRGEVLNPEYEQKQRHKCLAYINNPSDKAFPYGMVWRCQCGKAWRCSKLKILGPLVWRRVRRMDKKNEEFRSERQLRRDMKRAQRKLTRYVETDGGAHLKR